MAVWFTHITIRQSDRVKNKIQNIRADNIRLKVCEATKGISVLIFSHGLKVSIIETLKAVSSPVF